MKTNTLVMILIIVASIGILGGLFTIGVGTNRLKKTAKVRAIMNAEYSYMQGQKDCMNGEIRITKRENDYVWIKSSWNSGTLPIFNSLQEYKNHIDDNKLGKER